MQFRSFVLAALLFLPYGAYLPLAGPSGVDPDQDAPVVVAELFTSEGCSSCPPADALLQKIHLTQTAEGQIVVGLSEHVTYWNHLGWTDPYSAQVFTDRQIAYARRLSPGGPYTPQMVINGRTQFVGSDASALRQALHEELHRRHAIVKILSSKLQAGNLQLRFSLRGAASKQLDLMAVLTDDADHSSVRRGENSGRTLQHVSVARVLTRIATVSGDTEQTVLLPVPRSFQEEGSSQHHLVLFAQEKNQGAIVGAAVGPL